MYRPLVSTPAHWIVFSRSVRLHQRRGCFSLLDYIHGFWRDFDLTDTSIQHAFTVHERVPVRIIDFRSLEMPYAYVELDAGCTRRVCSDGASLLHQLLQHSIVVGPPYWLAWAYVLSLLNEFPSIIINVTSSSPFSHPHRRRHTGDENNRWTTKTRSDRPLPT